MLKIPTYVSRLNTVLSKGDEATKKYLMNMSGHLLIKICASQYVKFCDSNNFWKEKYLYNYYDVSGFPSDTNWKQRYIERYNRDTRGINFYPLSDTEKLKIMKSFDYEPLDNSRYYNRKSLILSNPNISRHSKGGSGITIFKALIIYNNKEKMNKPTLEDIVKYYDLSDKPEIASVVLNFYTGANKLEDTESFEHMFNVSINSYINDLTTDLDKKISKITDVPNYDPSYIPNINNGNTKKGIIFCHGHKHRKPQIPVKIDKNVNWILVDTLDKVNPDVVGGYDLWNTLQKLGLKTYDYVLSQYCPIGGNLIELAAFIRNMRWLLKNGGSLVIIPGRSINHNIKVSDKILDAVIYKYGYTKYIRTEEGKLMTVEIFADE